MSICSRSSTWLSLQSSTRPTGSINGIQETHSPTCFPTAEGRQPHTLLLPTPPRPFRPPPASEIYSYSLRNLGGNASCLRPFLAPPLQSQIERPRRNLPSAAPDGVNVRVELLHSRSQELEEPFGEKVAARGPGHRGPRPGHSSGTSPRHLELPFRRNLPRGPPGAEAQLKWPRGGAREMPAPTQPPGFLGNGVWRPQGGEKGRVLKLSVVVVLHKPRRGG